MAEQNDHENAQNCENTAPEKKVIGRPFQPGAAWTGNAGGRPKRKWLTEATEEMLKEKLSDPAERKRWQEAQWSKMLKHGVVGAMFMDKAWERTEGKIPQDLNLGGTVNLTISERLKKARERKSRK